jgi:hypothetical protein
VILFTGGGEAGHQMSQGSWNANYDGITCPNVAYQGTRGVEMWSYEFNRNRWYTMKGISSLPPTQYSRYPIYDPVHDVLITGVGSQTYVYNYHYNNTASYNNPLNFSSGLYSNAVDIKRGLYYMLCGGTQVMYAFDPETATWSQVSGIIPGCVPPPGASGNEPSINAMAYDPLHDIMLYLIGMSSPQTWKFDCAAKQWQQLTPVASPAIMGRLAYNKALNVFMLLGGEGTGISRGGGTTGLWTYRYATGATVEDNMVAAPDASLNSTGGVVRLSWKPLADAGVTGYNIYRGTANPYPKAFTKLNASPVTDTFYTDNTAASGTWYSYRVCGVKGGVEGKLSRHLYTRSTRPLGVAASVETASQVKVSWYANPEPDITGYNIYRARGASIYTGSMYTKLNSTPVNATEYVDNVDLSDLVARGYVVTAVNALGIESGYSPVATTFPEPPDWCWILPKGATFDLHWQPPLRTKVASVSMYRTTGSVDLYNTSGPIVDTVTSGWTTPQSTGTDAASLMALCFIVRAKNILGQEGYATNQISPVNTEFGYGQVFPVGTRFNYSQYVTSLEEAPASVSLASGIAASPNPFHPAVKISYRLDQTAKVRLKVIDTQGRIVRDLEVSRKSGVQTDRLDFAKLASGVYVVTVETGNAKILRTRVVYAK